MLNNSRFSYNDIEHAVTCAELPLVGQISSLRKISRTIRKMRSPALTLCGESSIQFLKQAMTTVLGENIPGDFIEAGVWRGGIPILMRAFLKENNEQHRKVWLADSFEGLPTNWRQMKDVRDRLASILMQLFGQLAVDQQQVENSFRRFDLLDQQVKFLPGWFNETLTQLPPQNKFALIRLDGDYYESTKDAITSLYPLLSSKGFIILDDYHLPLGCKRAVEEYRQQNGIDSEIISINSQSVYWRK